MDFLICILRLNISLALHLKYSSFGPSGDVKPMSNDLMHALQWQCMFALSLSMCVCVCV